MSDIKHHPAAEALEAGADRQAGEGVGDQVSDCEPPCDRRPVTVPSRGTWLVVDGRVMEAEVDVQGYAGPQVHLITTREPWGGPSLAERIRAGVEQAEAGRTIDRGDFSNYLDGEEP